MIVYLLQQYLPLAVLKHLLSIKYITILLPLQQYLPLAVLKQCHSHHRLFFLSLQQYLPLAVLKLQCQSFYSAENTIDSVATVLTACGIETNKGRELHSAKEWVATVLTACGIET